MKVLKSYTLGVKEASSQSKMIIFIWLINLLFGSVIYFSFSGLISGFIGKSVLADKLLKEFDFNVFFEIIVHEGGKIHLLLSVAFLLILLYFLVSIFLDGGILFNLSPYRRSSGEFNEKHRFASAFFHGAGKFFGRFFRLYVYSLILWGIFIIFLVFLNLLAPIITAKGTKEMHSFYVFWFELGIGLVMFFLIRMILDYARIEIVDEDSPKVFRALFVAVRFVFRNFWRTHALYYLLILTCGALFGIYLVLNAIIPSYSLITILIVFIVQQLFITSRGWLRIAVLSAQLQFYSLKK